MRILHIVHYNAENKLAFIEILFSFLCTFFSFSQSFAHQEPFFFSTLQFSLIHCGHFRFSTPLINWPNVICSLLSFTRCIRSRKKNIQILTESVIEYLSLSVIVTCDHLDTLSKKRDNNEKISTLHIRTVILFIDRKSRHINRMNNIQMEIDIFSNSIEITVTFSFHLFSLVAVAVVLFIGWCTRKSQAGLKWRNIATINKQVESKQN